MSADPQRHCDMTVMRPSAAVEELAAKHGSDFALRSCPVTNCGPVTFPWAGTRPDGRADVRRSPISRSGRPNAGNFLA